MADLRIVDAPEIPTENITGKEKLPTGGNGNYSISLDSLADYTKNKKDLADNTSVDGKVDGVRQELNTHIEDLLNPHQVTKSQIGLGNVDNTADADKPVSNSTQSAIISAVAPKSDKTYVDNQLTLKANKADVYTKQESSDLVNSSISTALTPVNTSLDLAKRGIVNRYDPLLTYNSGERVVLTNGDIVKSTIDGNTNDPNVGMTGWLNISNTGEVESIADLIAISSPKNGARVFAKQAVVGSGMGGGWFYYSETQTKTHDGFIVINHGTGQWQKITIAYPTVFDFGAMVGDTDSSAAFNACAASPYTGLKVITGDYAGYLTIASQVDLQGKDLVGSVKTTTDNSKFEKCSIYVVNGNFTVGDYAFVNVGNVKSVSITDKTTSLVLNCISLKTTYDASYDYVNIRGFGIQSFGLGGVFFAVKNCEFFNFSDTSFKFGSTAQPAATCINFDTVMFQWGNQPISFEKELSGSNFKNVIFEYTNGGVKASAIYNCTFENIWAEYTNDGTARPWIESTQSQQITRNTYINIINRGQFTNPASTDAEGGAAGGNSLDGSGISVSGSTGAKIKLDVAGLSTRFDKWYGGAARRLLITTQPRAADSNYYTPLYINAPTQRLFFGNQDETSSAPVVFNRVIGSGADGVTPFYSADTYTKVLRSWDTHDHISNTSGKFYAPRMLTYRSRLVTQQVNAGYSISKVATGIYRISRTSETVLPLQNPHIMVSGITSGNDKGDGSFTVSSIQFRDSYAGSWSAASECSGFDVIFRDSTNALKDVTNFTVSFSNS